MSTSAVTICNLALARIGQSQYIASFAENTVAARFCARFYDLFRDEALSALSWPFATSFAELALRTEEPNDEWQFEYSLPADCLAARRIVTSARIPPFPKFEVGESGTVRVLWTDEGDAVLRYTARVEDPQRWPTTFSTALAWRLAAELAMPLGCKPALREACDKKYSQALSIAGAQAFNEGEPDAPPEADMITARG